MFNWLKDFFVTKQTFVSTMGDLLGGVALIAASPEAQTALVAVAGPWATLGIAFLAYLGGAVSGRRTKQ